MCGCRGIREITLLAVADPSYAKSIRGAERRVDAAILTRKGPDGKRWHGGGIKSFVNA